MTFFERFSQVIITECICVALLIVSVFVCKYFFENTYSKVKTWYIENVCVDTDINEVLSDEI